MAKNKVREIKITRDGRFHAMGLVVNTFQEAVERCTLKGIGNYFLIWPEEKLENYTTQFEVCGTPEYLEQFLN